MVSDICVKFESIYITGHLEARNQTLRRGTYPFYNPFVSGYTAFTGVAKVVSPSKLVPRERFVSTRQRHFYQRTSKRCVIPSARSMTMVTQARQHSSTIPEAVRDANTVIVGGGPTGLLTAIFMAQRNIPVTVIEQDDDFSRFDPSRTYTLRLNERGCKVLRQVPKLLQRVAKDGVVATNRFLIMHKPDGTCKTLKFISPPTDGVRYILTPRISLVESLQSYAAELEHIKLLKKTQVTNVIYHSQRDMEVRVNCEGKEFGIHSKLILACDGRKSILGETLRSADSVNDGLFRSTNGLGTDSVPTLTSGRLCKSIVLQENYNSREPEFEEDLTDFSVLRQFLPTNGRSDKHSIWFGVFNTSKAMRDRCEGIIGIVSYLPETELHSAKTVEDGYNLFEEILPQLNSRSCISPESMKKFIEARPLRFPKSSRVESLVVHVGSTPSAGVVFLGDAAHSFPPDAGQGVNSAFEDVLVFTQVLDGMDKNASIEDILREYEAERDADVRALTTIVRRAATPVGGFSPKLLFRIWNHKARGLLAKLFPNVFYPSLFDAMEKNYAYRDALRLHDLTTTRLLAMAALIPCATILGGLGLLAIK